MVKKQVSEETLNGFLKLLVKKIKRDNIEFTKVLAIARGGIPLGKALSEALNLPLEEVRISFYQGQEKREKPIVNISKEKLQLKGSVLIVDDLVDTGATVEVLTRFLEEEGVAWKIAVFFAKPTSTVVPDYFVKDTVDWIVFPWEKD